MKREDDQELWDLLGKAAEQPTLSPFFARNVVRQIRQEPSWRERLTWWLTPRWLLPAGAVAAAVVVAAVSFDRPAEAPITVATEMPVAVQLDPIDYQVVADLDTLLAMEEDNLWTDAEVSTL
jgi:hypothetical protein